AGAGGAHAAPRSSNRGLRILAAILAVLVLAVGAGFAIDHFGGGPFSQRSTVTIPKLQNSTQQDAVNQLEKLGLQVNV
ncbi:hypothetical protein, partial [Enterococcus faecalis]